MSKWNTLKAKKLAEGFGPIYRDGKQNPKYYNPNYPMYDDNKAKVMPKTPKKPPKKGPNIINPRNLC